MKDDLKNKLDIFWNICEKGPSRYRSWIWCYEKFQENFFGNELNDKTYDYLALNLAFYLASWGMYRGSSLILQLDYKVYIGLLEKLRDDNEGLTLKNEEIDLMENIENISDIYEKILNYFNEKRKEYHEKGSFYLPEPTSTLATKILMGIYGITPAFDRYFIEGRYLTKKQKP